MVLKQDKEHRFESVQEFYRFEDELAVGTEWIRPKNVTRVK